MTSPPQSIRRCSACGPLTIRVSPDSASKTRSPVASTGCTARTASTRGSTPADQIGSTEAHAWAGSSGKVQPPVRREVGIGCHTGRRQDRSEEHTSELQSLMRISYAVFCLKKKNKKLHKEHWNKPRRKN